jgi:quercetin dioxygenase-like cupin family protein
MSAFKIDFDAMEWQEGREGVRFKLYCEGQRQIRLVDFASSDGFDDWCELGHIGYVIKGSLVIDCNGHVHAYKAGDGIFLPAGHETRHRAVMIEPGTRLVMVEDAAAG